MIFKTGQIYARILSFLPQTKEKAEICLVNHLLYILYVLFVILSDKLYYIISQNNITSKLFWIPLTN